MRLSGPTTGPINQTVVTGEASGTSYVSVGDYRYTVHVKYDEKSPDIVTGSSREDSQTVSDYTFAENKSRYTVNVIELDLSTVAPLEVGFWIINHPVDQGGVTEIVSNVDHNGNTQTNAQRVYFECSTETDGIYSADGLALASLIAREGIDSHMTDNEVVFWKGVVLDTASHQQTTGANGNESLNGTDFTHIRCRNNAWQVFNGTDWGSVTDGDQIAAYYLQVTNQEVVKTQIADWGKVYGETSHNDADFVALDFAVQYEDGSTKYRHIGTIRAEEISAYSINDGSVITLNSTNIP